MTYANILVEIHDRVGLIRLNWPQALNALSRGLIADLNSALEALERDSGIGAIVLTGSERAFAAGADIKEIQDNSFADAYLGNLIAPWEYITSIRKPVIAAVAGFALGGGCELAMMCDFILAADTAKFGQPEIELGVIPGAGGTQRLTRFIGKSKAMDMILTGRMMDAAEAERSGLVSRVFPAADLIPEALKIAAGVAALGAPLVFAAKESVNRAYETTWPKASDSSAEYSMACSQPKIKKRACARSPKSAPPNSSTGRLSQCARDIERRARPNRIEILGEPGLCAGSPEIAQGLQEAPRHVEFRRRAEALQLSVSADAMQEFVPIGGVLQGALLIRRATKSAARNSAKRPALKVISFILSEISSADSGSSERSIGLICMMIVSWQSVS